MANSPLPAEHRRDLSVTGPAPLSPPPPSVPNAYTRFPAFARRTEDGLMRLVLSVDGVNCAHCIQKIESSLGRDPAVREARVNFSTRRLNLVWDGTPEKAADLAERVESLGYRVHPFDGGRTHESSEAQARSLLLAMTVAGFASGNIMLLSFALWTTTGAEMGDATRFFMHLVSGLIAIPTALFSGRPFFASAGGALRKGRTNMDVPISMAVILTTLMSVFQTATHAEHAYFDSVVMLLFFLLVGRYFDFRARQHARSAATDLLSMLSGTATQRLEDGSQKILPLRDVREGMTLLVAMGENIPADGVVAQGESAVDTSLVTGETVPRPVQPGTPVYAGTLNMSAPLSIHVSKATDDSLLADIVRLMEKAEQGQARYVRLADRIARLYTPVVHLLALFTLLGWVFVGGLAWQPALMIAVTVLIITCPCALGLAVPVVQVLATGLLMKRGVLVKAGDAFERLARIDTLLLDKTGTLTLGKPVLDEGTGTVAAAAPPLASPEHRHLAASLAAQSQHPLAKALAQSWPGTFLPLEVREHPGQGLEAPHHGATYRLGNRRFCGMREEEGDTPDPVSTTADATSPPQSELWLTRDGVLLAHFTFTDAPRPDAAAVVAKLKALGLRLLLLSGDRAETARKVADALGVTDAEGGLTPPDKVARLEALRAQGHVVGMVGDGLNDAPVLAGADVSLSPSTAIDMAQNAADIVFMGEKLAPVPLAIITARRTQVLVRQNIAFALLYNVVAVPLAMAGMVTPLLAALAMSSSSLIVIGNAFRLKRGVEGDA